MFEKLLQVFSKDSTQKNPLPEADAEHAFGALLVRVAKADRAYLFEELARIDELLAQRMGLNVVQAAKFRADCEKLEEAMPDTAQLSEILAADLDLPQRETMFTDLWDVLMADGMRHHSEEEVVAQVASIFGIPADRAKHLVSDRS